MNRNSAIKLAKELLKKRLNRAMTNNFFVFWEGEKKEEIPEKSLVIILTKYEPESPNSPPHTTSQ